MSIHIYEYCKKTDNSVFLHDGSLLPPSWSIYHGSKWQFVSQSGGLRKPMCSIGCVPAVVDDDGDTIVWEAI